MNDERTMSEDCFVCCRGKLVYGAAGHDPFNGERGVCPPDVKVGICDFCGYVDVAPISRPENV